ncbi:MAG: hypothetical protein KF861_03755 [Planctomycetaceae bacterium]|nr:hypothetical protein [Planctomycetaceae bacterium]
MTTHGGYTLLLGNNPAYYREVVDQPWGTIWDGSVGGGQEAWAESLNQEMDVAGVTGEVARDHWMSARAREHIREDPRRFWHACRLRVGRFWSLTPAGIDGTRVPSVARITIGLFYGATFLLAVCGVILVLSNEADTWMPALLLVLAFSLVHVVYWTDARMRAPVTPVIALLAARAVGGRSTSQESPDGTR